MKASLVKSPGHIVILAAVVRGASSGDEKYQRSIDLLQRYGVDQFAPVKKHVRCDAIREYGNTLLLERNVRWQLGFKFRRRAYDSGLEAVCDGIPVVLHVYCGGASEWRKQECAKGSNESQRRFCYGHVIPGLFPEQSAMVA